MRETAFAEKVRNAASLSLGPFGVTAFAPNDEPYVVLCGLGGEEEAAAAFEDFTNGKTGALSWRVPPEFRPGPPPTYYMRLLVV